MFPEEDESIFVRFARSYGWRAFAVPVLIVITAWVLWDVVVRGDIPVDNYGSPTGISASSVQKNPGAHGDIPEGEKGPDPAAMPALQLALADLPEGGEYTLQGDGTYRTVGRPGAQAGTGSEKIIRYVVEVENGVDTAAIGGDDAFAAMVDATLTNPKGWTHDPRFRFEHISSDERPNMRIQLSSVGTTHRACGNELKMETSCFNSAGNRVVINESRWVRGAGPFQGDLGSYRQYLLNHEVGHGIGYAHHEACGGDGELAPVMMQQTLNLNNSELHRISPEEVYPDDNATCRYNAWPYPKV
ncbi:DUF3152 domain-containing protein [Corynebacterium caspium]|uniref:DUF3152 domain-containing protein n=1 Tax=Corynebacterium caspium TaxID=234828 RepID=UPI000381A5D2|nr:DUF3152 domain-containing protein [Corynebacterium caspium]WKD59693.1 hypothetical protein CCASP_06570 [Corynebacterium caspium DSM 44850]